MDHKPNCLIFLCTCNVQTNSSDSEQENSELTAILDGIGNVKYLGDEDV